MIRSDEGDKKYESDLKNARRSIEESVQIGRSTLFQLEKQNESLENTEDTLESSQFVLDKSLRILRGMTWSGYLYNILTPASTTLTSSSAIVNNQKSTTLSSVQNIDIFHDQSNENNIVDIQTTSQLKSSLSQQRVQHNNSTDQDGEKKELLEISRSVEELHSIAETMGGELDKQNNYIDRIDEKLMNTYDMTVQCTIKASQFSNKLQISSSTRAINNIGRYQFKYIIPHISHSPRASLGTSLQSSLSSFLPINSMLSITSSSSNNPAVTDTSSANSASNDVYTTLVTQQYFLAVDMEGNLILSTNNNKATYFDLFTRGDSSNIYALQNVKTMTFLTITLFGTIKAFGRNFGANEELFLEIDQNEAKLTGIYFIKSGSWLTSNGGWLQNPVSLQHVASKTSPLLSHPQEKTSDNSSSTSSGINTTINNVDGCTTNKICLNNVTNGFSDKSNLALFLPLPCNYW